MRSARLRGDWKYAHCRSDATRSHEISSACSSALLAVSGLRQSESRQLKETLAGSCQERWRRHTPLRSRTFHYRGTGFRTMAPRCQGRQSTAQLRLGTIQPRPHPELLHSDTFPVIQIPNCFGRGIAVFSESPATELRNTNRTCGNTILCYHYSRFSSHSDRNLCLGNSAPVGRSRAARMKAMYLRRNGSRPNCELRRFPGQAQGWADPVRSSGCTAYP